MESQDEDTQPEPQFSMGWWDQHEQHTPVTAGRHHRHHGKTHAARSKLQQGSRGLPELQAVAGGLGQQQPRGQQHAGAPSSSGAVVDAASKHPTPSGTAAAAAADTSMLLSKASGASSSGGFGDQATPAAAASAGLVGGGTSRAKGRQRPQCTEGMDAEEGAASRCWRGSGAVDLADAAADRAALTDQRQALDVSQQPLQQQQSTRKIELLLQQRGQQRQRGTPPDTSPYPDSSWEAAAGSADEEQPGLQHYPPGPTSNQPGSVRSAAATARPLPLHRRSLPPPVPPVLSSLGPADGHRPAGASRSPSAWRNGTGSRSPSQRSMQSAPHLSRNGMGYSLHGNDDSPAGGRWGGHAEQRGAAATGSGAGGLGAFAAQRSKAARLQQGSRGLPELQAVAGGLGQQQPRGQQHAGAPSSSGAVADAASNHPTPSGTASAAAAGQTVAASDTATRAAAHAARLTMLNSAAAASSSQLQQQQQGRQEQQQQQQQPMTLGLLRQQPGISDHGIKVLNAVSSAAQASGAQGTGEGRDSLLVTTVFTAPHIERTVRLWAGKADSTRRSYLATLRKVVRELFKLGCINKETAHQLSVLAGAMPQYSDAAAAAKALEPYDNQLARIRNNKKCCIRPFELWFRLQCNKVEVTVRNECFPRLEYAIAADDLTLIALYGDMAETTASPSSYPAADILSTRRQLLQIPVVHAKMAENGLLPADPCSSPGPLVEKLKARDPVKGKQAKDVSHGRPADQDKERAKVPIEDQVLLGDLLQFHSTYSGTTDTTPLMGTRFKDVAATIREKCGAGAAAGQQQKSTRQPPAAVSDAEKLYNTSLMARNLPDSYKEQLDTVIRKKPAWVLAACRHQSDDFDAVDGSSSDEDGSAPPDALAAPQSPGSAQQQAGATQQQWGGCSVQRGSSSGATTAGDCSSGALPGLGGCEHQWDNWDAVAGSSSDEDGSAPTDALATPQSPGSAQQQAGATQQQGGGCSMKWQAGHAGSTPAAAAGAVGTAGAAAAALSAIAAGCGGRSGAEAAAAGPVKRPRHREQHGQAKRHKLDRQQEACSGSAARGSATPALPRGRGSLPPNSAATKDTPMPGAALHEELERLWTALLHGERGDCLTVLDVMHNCVDINSRRQVMRAVLRAPAGVVSALCEHTAFLPLLNTWLRDLMAEHSGADLHVLSLLEVLASLKAATWAALTASGLDVTLQQATKHRDRDVARKCTALLEDWEGRDPSRQCGPAAKKARLRSAFVLDLSQIGPQIAPQQRKPQQQQQQQQQPTQQQQQGRLTQQPQQQRGKPPQQQPKPSVAGATSAGESGEALSAFMSDASKEALAAQKAALEEAEKTAAAAAAELAALEAAQFFRSTAPAADGSAVVGVAADNKARATEQLTDFVEASLEAHLQAKELDNDGYKLLLRKVVSKVIDATSDADMAAEVFMAGTRVAKVSTLIDSYVLYHKQGKLRVSETVRAI